MSNKLSPYFLKNPAMVFEKMLKYQKIEDEYCTINFLKNLWLSILNYAPSPFTKNVSIL